MGIVIIIGNSGVNICVRMMFIIVVSNVMISVCNVSLVIIECVGVLIVLNIVKLCSCLRVERYIIELMISIVIIYSKIVMIEIEFIVIFNGCIKLLIVFI